LFILAQNKPKVWGNSKSLFKRSSFIDYSNL